MTSKYLSFLYLFYQFCVDYKTKVAIIIGSEGAGVGSVKELADKTIYIPMNKRCESLNASVAASIIMYEVSKSDYE